jgi:hypothetical protein
MKVGAVVLDGKFEIHEDRCQMLEGRCQRQWAVVRSQKSESKHRAQLAIQTMKNEK